MSRQLWFSEPVRKRLDELVASLQAAVGDALTSVIVYGSAVRGEWREGRSDVDVVVVCTNDEPATLRAMSNALLVARFAARIEAMILVDGEIGRASDAFPLLYDDIRRCHVVIAGSDPFEGLEIPSHHLRVRIEQELREAQIRIRRAVADAGMDVGALTGAVRRKVRQVRSPLKALLTLQGVECGDTLAQVYARAGEVYGTETGCLLKVSEDPQKALDAFRALLAKAIEDVDRRETQ